MKTQEKTSLKTRVLELLKSSPDKKYTSRDIAEWICEKYPEDCREKKERSNHPSIKAVVKQFAAEISAIARVLQKAGIKTTEGRPRKFYFTQLSDADEVARYEKAVDSKSKNNVLEHNLYLPLKAFLWDEHNVYSKRIDEKKSSNAGQSGSNKWLYPDMVGMEVLDDGWHHAIKECAKQYNYQKAKLWSFEVKRSINGSNVREAFIQAITNSSWANLGYLVAEDINSAALKELRILTGLHGIGFIQLNYEIPSESQILIPAKERFDIDWNVANRLAIANRDFMKFIKSVLSFHQTDGDSLEGWKFNV